MPFTKENHMQTAICNKNDHNYLHKKFKKVASSATLSDVESTSEYKPLHNIKISTLHQEIDKTRDNNVFDQSMDVKNDVQITNNKVILNVNTSENRTGKEISKTENLDNDFNREPQNGVTGRYMCPYCKLSCSKPSVLQKHIRAHTNERPFPCVPCGFAFKTKSNLYKHRRSRTHALRLQGSDITTTNEDDFSPGSDSDNSLSPSLNIDTVSECSVTRDESSQFRSNSSPELTDDRATPPSTSNNSLKTIYKPKFRAAFFEEIDEKAQKNTKSLSASANFLNEHISKIISDNEAIVDVIDTPLQKKYNKIKQIAENRQLIIAENPEIKSESGPLNLTKNLKDTDTSFRKRAHSESLVQIDFQKHPLNPEGSIIKDLLLKTKCNGMISVTSDNDTIAALYICPLCSIPYRSADNLEIHRLYYCKGKNEKNRSPKEAREIRNEGIFMRSNSINVKLPENQNVNKQISLQTTKSLSPRLSKPESLLIIKPESEVVAPLPSPGPLLGNTRLIDSKAPKEYIKKLSEFSKTCENFNSKISDNISPRLPDSYHHNKIRCLEPSSIRSIDEIQSHLKSNNSTSLQMFGGEVKIVDRSGSTTTLRIEPSKNQLSPILVHRNLSPTNFANASEASNIVVRSGLHSGGTLVHTPKDIMTPSKSQSSWISISTTSHLAKDSTHSKEMHHFQFPPLSAITAFNPLTLPPLSPSSAQPGSTSIFHGGKIIPHVPGIPGPNTSSILIENCNKNVNHDSFETKHNLQRISSQSPKQVSNAQTDTTQLRNMSIKIATDLGSNNLKHMPEQRNNNLVIPEIKIKNSDDVSLNNVNITLHNLKNKRKPESIILKRSHDGLLKTVRKDNTVVLKQNSMTELVQKNIQRLENSETDDLNFENVITKAEIYNNKNNSGRNIQKQRDQDLPEQDKNNERSETSYFQKNSNILSNSDDAKSKFLRPSTLPLKPGTFTPKKHHGITPNAHTMPLVSPETPRPAKAYGQLYLNGNAYTYLGLKCSTKVFYCTINRPQPTYVQNQHFLSMYSNWQLLSDLTPDPLGLSASKAMSLYDSRHRPQSVTIAKIKQELILTHSSNESDRQVSYRQDGKVDESKSNYGLISSSKKQLTGGFESNEEYTYIRGRGRGRYVCSECGIRCKKPSMLKKHIRTHTDVRPYTCTHCAFSFKTKGNLTKHMKSKAHYKKCCELGINPNEGSEMDCNDSNQCPGESDEDSDTDGDEGNEGETESSDTEIGKSRLPEHEAARCLLSLGSSRPPSSSSPFNPGLITSARPTTYPYTPIENAVSDRRSETNTRVSDSENEPMDLSKSDAKTNMPEIQTAIESEVLASLASNTAKLPLQQSNWSSGEHMLHAYLTEKALQDSKIKQSQLFSEVSKTKKDDVEHSTANSKLQFDAKTKCSLIELPKTAPTEIKIETPSTSKLNVVITKQSTETESMNTSIQKGRQEVNNENAKLVVSEFLKIAKINYNDITPKSDLRSENINKLLISKVITRDDTNDIISESASNLAINDHDPIARKVVIGAGGLAFKVLKGKDSDNGSTFSQGRLMEDGSRVCDFCSKSFTKPSQLRLHLNIHYMERPYRCSACAVSFRTRGHLQKHERSGSHHNKVSMTSTFGAATSMNPRPFRCSDCNIAFRIHGHLAKHLRSKMHVMRLECLFKLPFGTFTEIERAGVSLTEIDTTDCATSLTSLQKLARKLHENDPTKLEYREPSASTGNDFSEDEDGALIIDKTSDSELDSEMRTSDINESHLKETTDILSATDN